MQMVTRQWTWLHLTVRRYACPTFGAFILTGGLLTVRDESANQEEQFRMRGGEEQISSFEKFVLLISGFVIPWFCYPIVLYQENLRDLIDAAKPASASWLASIDEYLVPQTLQSMFPLVLLLYSAFWLLVINVPTHGKNPWLRFGLATGLPLVLYYHLVLQAQLRLTAIEATIYHVAGFLVGALCWFVGIQSFRRLKKRTSAILASTAFSFAAMSVTSIASVMYFSRSDVWIIVSHPSLLLLHGLFLPSSLIWFAAIARLISRVRYFYPLQKNYSLGYLIGWTTWLAVFFMAFQLGTHASS